MSGLTDEGFVSKRLATIKEEMESNFVSTFGVNLNTGAETVTGQIIGITAEAWADLWDQLDNVYQSQYPSTASGNSLDLLVALNGITRLDAAATSVTGYLMLESGTTVPEGSQAKDDDQTYSLQGDVAYDSTAAYGATVSVGTVADSTDYVVSIAGTSFTYTSGTSATAATILAGLQALLTDFDTEISGTSLAIHWDDASTVTVGTNMSLDDAEMSGTFQADDTGAISLAIGDLDEIETAVDGWDSVTNRAEGTEGRDKETDAELRVRRKTAIRISATNTLDSIQSNIAELDDVLSVTVLENSTTDTDENGVPPHYIWAIVDGGEDDEIAQVIFDYIAAGIGTYGDSYALAYTDSDKAYQINFDRPTSTPVYVSVTVNGSDSLPDTYVSDIQDALETWADDNLDISDDLILNRLYYPINQVLDSESYVLSIYIDTSADPTSSENLTATTAQRFQISAENVSVILN